MNPSSWIAAWTRALVRSATTSGWFSTLETVPRDTPARAATSLILTGVFATSPPERSVSGGAPAHVNLGQREHSRATAGAEAARRRHHLHLQQERGVRGPDNVAYGAAKADQAHQVRLLAAELGGHGIRVNGINPDGVVRGSGIFAGGWGARRAAVYGVPEEKLGELYAQRTLLKREVLPEHCAAAVFALVGGDLAVTTGLLVPVDAGVAAAFLR